MANLKESPSQTAGPYVHIGCTPNVTGITSVYETDLGATLKTGPVQGEAITIKGFVIDGAGDIVIDAMVEIWQADAQGQFNTDPNFSGWGRSAGDMDTGEFSFDTIKPGSVTFTDGTPQAPHITFWIVARGINLGLQTRMYFADEDNSSDPILSQITDKSRIKTLLATKDASGVYRFDIHLQGAHETIFFDA
jgi:protocatechuate 3,4-dioxygenase alpha subunit